MLADAAPSFRALHTPSRPDSKLREELQALRETFSNFTESTEVEVKALSSQGEGAWGWGWGAAEREGCGGAEQVSSQEEVWAER